SVKSIILDLDAQLKFVIDDLDETHLFIDASKVEMVRSELENILEENTYRVQNL
ncbi:hypothetical protein HDV03_003602, partial [Kappamyces sp. JEL0829]